ncbi:ribonuclease H-like domain-containing protein [Tanacetum coccineum]|uniref:Ribonuclease H-like domain-containing protein n=1 Tax=Tanacetum coccineum TaxID=301880 RepID=A0ABQ5CT71_9ASTR
MINSSPQRRIRHRTSNARSNFQRHIYNVTLWLYNNGLFVGATRKELTNVIAIGIGGSFLGPLFVHTALQTYAKLGVWVCVLYQPFCNDALSLINVVQPCQTIQFLEKNSAVQGHVSGPPGRKTIPGSYFFNRDLEYLKFGNEEKKYALSVTKIKDARYEEEGIEEMIMYLWSPSIQKYNRDTELGIHHWDPYRQCVQIIKVNKKYGYAYLEETVVKRTDEKEYMFAEPDFPNLNQNNIEDLYMLKIQNKIRNVKGVEEFDLINALQLYIKQSST